MYILYIYKHVLGAQVLVHMGSYKNLQLFLFSLWKSKVVFTLEQANSSSKKFPIWPQLPQHESVFYIIAYSLRLHISYVCMAAIQRITFQLFLPQLIFPLAWCIANICSYVGSKGACRMWSNSCSCALLLFAISGRNTECLNQIEGFLLLPTLKCSFW